MRYQLSFKTCGADKAQRNLLSDNAKIPNRKRAGGQAQQPIWNRNRFLKAQGNASFPWPRGRRPFQRAVSQRCVSHEPGLRQRAQRTTSVNAVVRRINKLADVGVPRASIARGGSIGEALILLCFLFAGRAATPVALHHALCYRRGAKKQHR